VNVRLVQLDGHLPNLALMALASWHRWNGDYVYRSTSVAPQPNEPKWDRVYGSSIFKKSLPAITQFSNYWPDGILGGTGTPSTTTVEQIIGKPWGLIDYTDYPDFKESIGFTQRGCRLACKFCVVPLKEGKPKSVNSIWEIWRGDPYPKKLHLLDNDFFGQPEWRERIAEIIEGGFRICLSQGINVRMITEESAAALASIQYRNTRFNERKLYTAWDNLRDEEVFFKGVDLLEAAGIPSKHLMAYMLIGFDKTETWERIWHRFNRMVERGIEPFPMVFDKSRTDLVCFQRWACRGLYRIVKWPDYKRQTKSQESVDAWYENQKINQNAALWARRIMQMKAAVYN
jgi:hypothetical protein